MRLAPSLLAAALLGWTAAPSAELPAVECVRLLREARIAAERGNRARELELLRQAARDHPKEILPAIALAEYADRTKIDARELERSRATIRERLADPGALVPYSALGTLAEDPMASAEETVALKRALEVRLARTPSDPDLLEAMALVLRRLPDREEERSILARLDGVRPSAAIAWRRAKLAEELGRREEALEIYRGTESRYGDSPVLRESIGRSLVALRRFEEAKQAAAALEAGPVGREGASRLSAERAWALWDDGRDIEAREAFGEAARENPGNEEAGAALRTLFATPDERKALAAAELDRLSRISRPDELLEAGTTRLLAGDAAAAALLLRRAVEASPDLELAWFNLGVASFGLDRFEEARGAFDRAAALKPDRAESFLYLGEALLKLDRCLDAIAPLLRALELRPGLFEAHASLSDGYRRLGRTEDADRELKLAKPSR